MTPTGDLGLQAQRTAPAWGRTGLAMIVDSLLVLRIGVNAADPSVQLLGVGFLAISGGVLMIGEMRSRRLAKEHTGASPREMGTCAICVVLVSLASVASIVG